jgi:CheY-like chemotaxis protein
MTKRVLDVGNCSADHALISGLVRRNFRAEVVRAHTAADTLRVLAGGRFDLLLVNRILDSDGSEGLDLIRAIRADPQLASLPVIMLSNYPEHQARAVAEGAEPGFGKAELQSAETRDKLTRFLGD